MIDFWVVYVLMFVNQTCKSPTGLPLQILEESAGNTLQSHLLSRHGASKVIFNNFVVCVIITPNLAESVGVAASMVGTYIPLNLLEKNNQELVHDS